MSAKKKADVKKEEKVDTTAKTSAKEKVEETPVVKEEKPVEKPVEKKAKTFSPSELVEVKNGFHGVLVYESSDKRDSFILQPEEVYIAEYAIIRKLVQTKPQYIRNGWIEFLDEELIDAVGARHLINTVITLSTVKEWIGKRKSEMKEQFEKYKAADRIRFLNFLNQMYRRRELTDVHLIRKIEEIIETELTGEDE